nr:NDR1/HIN1-like protein 26 [Ipomoea batatas]
MDRKAEKPFGAWMRAGGRRSAPSSSQRWVAPESNSDREGWQSPAMEVGVGGTNAATGEKGKSPLFESVTMRVINEVVLAVLKDVVFLGEDEEVVEDHKFASTAENSATYVISVRSPLDHKVGIYYDEVQVYASYKGQQITLYTSLPPFYQGHGEANLLSAYLQAGNGLPVAPSFSYQVQRDQSAGRLVLMLKVNGKLRWKVGTWVSGKYRFNVNCVAIMPFGGSMPSGPLISRQGTQCSTSI